MDDAELRSILIGGSEADRWHLAGHESLPGWAFEALLRRGGDNVIAVLVHNPGVPASVLNEIAARSDDLGEAARVHQNAPAVLKEASPLTHHSARSLDIYLHEKHASDEQRRRFVEASRAANMVQHATVGEVWAAANR